MSQLQSMSPDRVEHLKFEAYRFFGPMILKDALIRLGERDATLIGKFENAMLDAIEKARSDMPDFDLMKEFAVEQLLGVTAQARSAPHAKQDVESVDERRTPDRSEQGSTLEEQLQAGLEDTFPASDPPAVVSTAISGGSELKGVEEVLREKRDEPA